MGQKPGLCSSFKKESRSSGGEKERGGCFSRELNYVGWLGIVFVIIVGMLMAIMGE
ncbi:MAG: hypothetical protein IKP04_00780 [Candidatus Methanomethylophilaceae archaeon]|nr:hypothetical protein [Candidatus Methanomethylophilaceae archaeon]